MDRLKISCPSRAFLWFVISNPRRCHRAELNRTFSPNMENCSVITKYSKRILEQDKLKETMVCAKFTHTI
jgi:hypothetical protein